MASFTVRARLPLGPRLQALAAPAVARIAGRVNGASDPTVQADLVNLPRHLDRVDRWITQGVMGGEAPNAADLQVGASLRLLLAFGDVAPLIEPRPAARVARTQYPGVPGHVPAGTLPAGWLPA